MIPDPRDQQGDAQPGEGRVPQREHDPAQRGGARGAHVRRRPQQHAAHAARALAGDDHDRIEALEEHQRHLRQAADAEGEDEDREEGELRHRVGAGEERIEQRGEPRRAAHQHADGHAGERREREAGERALQRDPGFEQRLGSREKQHQLAADLLQRRKENGVPQAAAADRFPPDKNCDDQKHRCEAPHCQASAFSRTRESRRSPA